MRDTGIISPSRVTLLKEGTWLLLETEHFVSNVKKTTVLRLQLEV